MFKNSWIHIQGFRLEWPQILSLCNLILDHIFLWWYHNYWEGVKFKICYLMSRNELLCWPTFQSGFLKHLVYSTVFVQFETWWGIMGAFAAINVIAYLKLFVQSHVICCVCESAIICLLWHHWVWLWKCAL